MSLELEKSKNIFLINLFSRAHKKNHNKIKSALISCQTADIRPPHAETRTFFLGIQCFYGIDPPNMDRKPSTLASNACFNGSTSANSKDDHDNNNKSLEKRDCNDKAENKIVGFFLSDFSSFL